MKGKGLCWFDYKGFCKYRDTCLNHHFPEVCQDKSCISNTCQRRHPRSCYFYRNFGNCQFGSYCRYLHEKTIGVKFRSNFEEFRNLENEVKLLKSEVKIKQEALVKETKAIEILKERVSQLGEENNKLHIEIKTCEIIAQDKLPQLNLKNVKRDFVKLKEENKNLNNEIIVLNENFEDKEVQRKNIVLEDEMTVLKAEMTTLRERNSKLLARLKEEAQRNQRLDSEIDKLKMRLGDDELESDYESNEN